MAASCAQASQIPCSPLAATCAEASQIGTKIVWRVKGCLTHSHETDDTGKSLRLSKRVRKNIGLLLKLDLPMQIIRSKYLKMENFGGSSGKVPSIESARQIQLATYPAPPDLSCPEMEIVFRYMRYNLSGNTITTFIILSSSLLQYLGCSCCC